MQELTPKLKSWASVIEPQALAQAAQAAEVPVVDPWLSLMPDVHAGIGSTVGSVIPTVDAIIPAAVGVDIGCGMRAVKTTLTIPDLGDLRRLRGTIERNIPRGNGPGGAHPPESRQELPGPVKHAVSILEQQIPQHMDPDAISPFWRGQLGTLGGGNHFLELSVDEDGFVWCFLHSGSRHIGKSVADVYIKLAASRISEGLPVPDKNLCWLDEGTQPFSHYLAELWWVQDYAQLNRSVMMQAMLRSLEHHLGTTLVRVEDVECHHNYTSLEEHFGRPIWITRKGAIEASEGQPGLIPGSMGTPSYVVTGKGNPESFRSAPHGAGRTMSRRQAKETIAMDRLKQQMSYIECHLHPGMLDEAPDAYKPIDQVMADASDLVTIQHTLKPVLNVKG